MDLLPATPSLDKLRVAAAVSKLQLGRHLLIEMYGCDPLILDDAIVMDSHMLAGAAAAGATIISSHFHRFCPQGVSGVVLIAESHLAIHTWPEYGYAAVDLFTCGASARPERCHDLLVQAFRAKSSDVIEIARGDHARIAQDLVLGGDVRCRVYP